MSEFDPVVEFADASLTLGVVKEAFVLEEGLEADY